MTPAQKPRIGITLGDLNGIGPEVVMKALADNRMLSLITPVIYGSSKVIAFYKKQLNIEEFNYSQVRNKGQFAPKTINIINCWEDNLEIVPGKASRESGRASFLAIKQACEELKEGMIDALVTGPIDKNSIHHDEFPFKGHTEYLTNFFGGESLMLHGARYATCRRGYRAHTGKGCGSQPDQRENRSQAAAFGAIAP